MARENAQPATDATSFAEGMAEQQGKRTAKATIFEDIFSDPAYRLQLVQALHPEMEGLAQEEIVLLTLVNVLLDEPYNDLGLFVRDKLLILVEAQATWSVNILIRLLLYLAETYKRLIRDKKWDIYGTKALPLPEPEFYVIYTGEWKRRPKEIRFSTEFFGGKETAVEIAVKVLYGNEQGDIISEYVTFCHVLDEQYRKLGRTVEAIRETIRICKDRDVLRKYLEEREGEVVDIMLTLFDQETVLENHVASRVREAEAKAAAKADKAARADQDLTRIRSLMANMKLTAQDAMTALSIPLDQQAIYIKKL